MNNKEIKTSIIILTYNCLDYTKTCIESIKKYTSDIPHEVIVIDNHSTDGTVEWLKAQHDIKVIFNEENLGFPKGCNQGINIADPESDILLLNNDVVVTTNWLSNLQIALYSEEKIGAVGAITNNCTNDQQIDVDYNDLTEMQDYAARNNISDSTKWEQKIRLIGFCLLIKRSAIKTVGVLDESFSPGNCEDDDYSFRLIHASYKLLLCHDAFIHHYGHASFSKDNNAFSELLRKNREIFLNKWGFSINYSCIVRSDIIDFIKRHRNANFRVLEVGCACGATLLRIKYQYKNVELFGLEINPEASKIAASFANISASDIEKSQLEYPPEFFDYIIFADVLEHLYDPWKVLSDMKKYLKPSGSLIISIPNIMHYSIIIGLMNGNWTYQDAGILDKTHLRFFTFNEICKMLKQTGYTEFNFSSTRLPSCEEEPIYLNILTAITSKELESQYRAYQYLVSAKKS